MQNSKNDSQLNLDCKIRLLLLLDQKEKIVCEKSYFVFFKWAWKVLEPHTPLKLNWHMEYLCDLLQKEIERIGKGLPKKKDIIINVPPRSAKSYITSVMLQPWAWIHYPHLKFISSSHSKELSTMHCVYSRDLIQSDWYQKHWGKNYQLTDDQNAKTYYQNSARGHRIATSVSGGAIGKGADIIVADDLLNAEEVESEKARKAANNHYDTGLYTRINDLEVGVRIVVMQRLHEEDVTGHLLKKNKSGYLHINIPAEITNESLGTEYDVKPPELKEFYTDNLFFPTRFTRPVLEEAKTIVGSHAYPGQFLQRVSPPGGNIFKRKWFNYYLNPPESFERVIQVWDMRFKEGQTGSFVVGQVWGRVQKKNYLLHQYRKRADFLESRQAVLDLTRLYPSAYKKIFENKANGPAIENSLKSLVKGIEFYDPKGASKESRWMSIAPRVELGTTYLPHPDQNPWVEDLLNELESVPNAANDDQADCLFMAINEFEGSTIEDLKALLKF